MGSDEFAKEFEDDNEPSIEDGVNESHRELLGPSAK